MKSPEVLALLGSLGIQSSASDAQRFMGLLGRTVGSGRHFLWSPHDVAHYGCYAQLRDVMDRRIESERLVRATQPARIARRPQVLAWRPSDNVADITTAERVVVDAGVFVIYPLVYASEVPA